MSSLKTAKKYGFEKETLSTLLFEGDDQELVIMAAVRNLLAIQESMFKAVSVNGFLNNGKS